MTSSPSSWITNEIQQMMFGFGDSRKPSEDTAALVAEVVHQHMVSMIHQALDVSGLRGEKAIGVEDILFLLRKDKVKLRRLLKFYEVKDLKNSLTRGGLLNSDDAKLELGSEKRTLGKNRSLCYEFLSNIDQTGELLALFDEKEPDIIKHERLVRAELRSRGMDTQTYMEFCQARQANFSRKYNKSQRFQNWLLPKDNDIVLSPSAVEIFTYLAYECVAQIVDLALLVKQDKRTHPGDPSSRCRPPLSVNYAELQVASVFNKDSGDGETSPSEGVTAPHLSAHLASLPPHNNPQTAATAQAVSAALSRPSNKKKRKKSGPPAVVEMSWDTQIMPGDVREALRRYYTDIGPFASCKKLSPHCSVKYKTLVN